MTTYIVHFKKPAAQRFFGLAWLEEPRFPEDFQPVAIVDTDDKEEARCLATDSKAGQPWWDSNPGVTVVHGTSGYQSNRKFLGGDHVVHQRGDKTFMWRWKGKTPCRRWSEGGWERVKVGPDGRLSAIEEFAELEEFLKRYGVETKRKTSLCLGAVDKTWKPI